MERGKRIELSASAWKAEVLPLYEPRINSGYTLLVLLYTVCNGDLLFNFFTSQVNFACFVLFFTMLILFFI